VKSHSWRSAKPVDFLANGMDRMSGLRYLRRLRTSKAVNRFADAVYHAQLVDESFRFAVRELADRSQPSIYRPRERSLHATIRHRSGDLFVLNEIIRHGAYRFPQEALRRLEALSRPPRIVDAGANIGLFGIEVFDRFPEATVTAFEPDPANAAVHEYTIRVNRLDDRWTLIRSCAGTADGTVSFLAQGSVGSHVDTSPEAAPVAIVDLFPYLQQADLLKMDIEGSEWPILADARLRELDNLVFVFEYHQDACPHPDAHEAALRFVSDAGFTTYELDAPYQPDGTGLIWAWKQRSSRSPA
jgi:FkbM family methyltransferase